jgi:parallel beta-helix repeat protein
MKNLIFLLAFLPGISALNAAVTGKVTLDGQTDHSNIRIKFISQGGTAVSDSAFTDSLGVFSVNLTGGIYKVEFAKTGYQTFYYNNGNALSISSSQVLTPVILKAGTEVFVSGTVQGNWTKNNVYIVTGNLTVPASSTLNIQAGTRILFNGDYSLTVVGIMMATGSANENICFTSGKTSPTAPDWGGIEIRSGASNLSYCVIEYFKNCVYASNCSPEISNCVIQNFSDRGIYLSNSSAKISNNVIRYFDIGNAQGIVAYTGSPTIECNSIYKGSKMGIMSMSGGFIRNNMISDMGWAGVMCEENSHPEIRNNFISDCGKGFDIGTSTQSNINPTIVGNTIKNCVTGIAITNLYADGTLENNAIIDNQTGIKVIYSNPNVPNTPHAISYNLVWNNPQGNFVDVQKLDIGTTISSNANGDPCDAYFNINMDPKLNNENPATPGPNSPCYNAGDHSYGPNIGFEASNGCYYAISGLEEKTLSADIVYPNPIIDVIYLKLTTSGKVSLKLYDSTARLILEQESTSSDTELDLPQLQPGMYILQVSTNGNQMSYHRLIKN